MWVWYSGLCVWTTVLCHEKWLSVFMLCVSSLVGSFWSRMSCLVHIILISCLRCPLAGRRGRTTWDEHTMSTMRADALSGTDPQYSKHTNIRHITCATARLLSYIWLFKYGQYEFGLYLVGELCHVNNNGVLCTSRRQRIQTDVFLWHCVFVDFQETINSS